MDTSPSTSSKGVGQKVSRTPAASRLPLAALNLSRVRVQTPENSFGASSEALRESTRGSAARLHPALSLLPSGLFLLTAAHEGKRAGVFVASAQVCADDPAMLCIAMRKGHWIEPMIRDSHVFGVCVVDPADKLLCKKFGDVHKPREPGDPFDCFAVDRLVTGAPIVRRCLAGIDCEVARHMDIESDHELYIGRVMASRMYA